MCNNWYWACSEILSYKCNFLSLNGDPPYKSIKHLPMIKSTKYFDEIMHQKAKKYLQFWGRITKVHLLTCLKSFLHEFTEKCFAAFKWCTIYDELFLWYGWPTKGVKPYFQPRPLSEILTIANHQHAASSTWTCAEPEFRLCWMKLCSSDNHYTTVPANVSSISLLLFFWEFTSIIPF